MAINSVPDVSTMVGAAVKSITVGIAPHRGRRETEEYRVDVPVWLRNRRGLPGDEIAAILRQTRPELGIESEDDLYQLLAMGQRQRQTGDHDYDESERWGEMATNNGNGGNQFDPAAAREAVQEFAEVLQALDPAVIERLQAAWEAAYLKSGHKALGRYLISRDLARACKSFDKARGTDA